MLKWLKRLVILGILAALGGAGWLAMQPQPVAADLVTVTRGAMTVRIVEDGATRVRDVFRIASPLAGRVDRSLLEVGDPVTAGETVIARIHPMEPPFMDVRARAEAQARVEAATAAVSLAEAQLKQANAALALAISDYQRALRLSTSETISATRLQAASVERDLKRAAVDSANALVSLRKSEVASAEALLIQPGDASSVASADCCVEVKAPANGVVLALAVESENVVAAGAPLAEIGNPAALEIVVDLLSSDAVRIHPGTRAVIKGWGGPDLAATVRRIDPAGFVKVSALGIEERRVNVLLDLTEGDASLGHGYQVRVELVTWASDDVLTVPITALFRKGGDWAAFVLEGGFARLRTVKVGHMNAEVAEVLDGVAQGDTLIDFPGEAIADGVEIIARGEGD